MGDLRQLVAGGFANKNTAKAARNPGTVPSHPRGDSGDGDGGGVVPGHFPAPATTGVSRGEAAGGKGVRGMKEDGTTLEEAEGGGSGGGVPAPATGSAEEFSEKPQQQGGPKTAQVTGLRDMSAAVFRVIVFWVRLRSRTRNSWEGTPRR